MYNLSAITCDIGLESTSAKQQSMLDHLHSVSDRDQASLEQVQQTSARGQAHVQGMQGIGWTLACSGWHSLAATLTQQGCHATHVQFSP